jgi:hypothetical protein
VFSYSIRPVMAVLVVLAAAVGALFGLVPSPRGSIAWVSEAPHSYPLPHCVPKYPDGVSLRFAMVHDALHERYARHGETYYQERNRRVGEALGRVASGQGPDPSSDEALALFDDMGVGLDALQQDDEAVRLMREKLRRQEALGKQGRQLYTTYANLGTFLIHGNFRAAVRGDTAAKERLREGIGFIAKSIEVNPEAHFGRETWQKGAAEFLLDAIDNLQILLERDLVGDSLAEEIDPSGKRCLRDGRSYSLTRADRQAFLFVDGRESEAVIIRELIRDQITKVGKGSDVPFDEPTLGIIGMWRLGGGANPHFALALGEMMIRVGQRRLAWCAYERAVRLADRFWPIRSIQENLVEHCRRRQRVIERELPDEERDQLRPQFDAELEYGQRYQENYQTYEAERIAEGSSIDDEHFYDTFFADHEPIASPVGDADWVVMQESSRVNWAVNLVSAGLFAFSAACLLRFAIWSVDRFKKSVGVLGQSPADEHE